MCARLSLKVNQEHMNDPDLKRINELHHGGARIVYLECCGGNSLAPNWGIRKKVALEKRAQDLTPPDIHQCVCGEEAWTTWQKNGIVLEKVKATSPTKEDLELEERLTKLRYETSRSVTLVNGQYVMGGTKGSPPPFKKTW